uniref:Transmembrane protein n=1 Tax=Cacopsylla melanoneura TaxID=428564 RepID=A0A8D9AVS9_9HEMI
MNYRVEEKELQALAVTRTPSWIDRYTTHIHNYIVIVYTVIVDSALLFKVTVVARVLCYGRGISLSLSLSYISVFLSLFLLYLFFPLSLLYLCFSLSLSLLSLRLVDCSICICFSTSAHYCAVIIQVQI